MGHKSKSVKRIQHKYKARMFDKFFPETTFFISDEKHSIVEGYSMTNFTLSLNCISLQQRGKLKITMNLL